MEGTNRSRLPASKIVARERLPHRIGTSARIVLANGLFDLVHVGHARYFEGARRMGDRLVVALNDDRSAAAGKGPCRPIVPLAERMEVIAAFRAVDFVTWFPEETVAETLRLLAPAVHAKGTDYRPATLPAEERSVHESLGIEVAIVGDPKTHATRSLIDKILGR